jgi:hypothetical protein
VPLVTNGAHANAAPLRSGEELNIEGLGRVRLGEVTARNWSHVAAATGPSGERLFCKQFVDRLGAEHPAGYTGEKRTRELLAGTTLPAVEVVPIIGYNDERLVMVSPHVDMITIDSIPVARSKDRAQAEAVGHALAAILDACRLPESPERVAVWKGIDPKNIGWDDTGRLWIFDFGPPSELPIDGAAGRLVAAGLLSRWVARIGPHLLWPERTILHSVCAPLAQFTTYEEVERRLTQNHDLRRREPQRTGRRAAATRLGLNTVGRIYWATARREARRLFDE